jgi:hypothetical protein
MDRRNSPKVIIEIGPCRVTAWEPFAIIHCGTRRRHPAHADWRPLLRLVVTHPARGAPLGFLPPSQTLGRNDDKGQRKQ